MTALAWGDLRPASPIVSAPRRRCGDHVWVYNRHTGAYTGSVDCTLLVGHPGNHESLMYGWEPGVTRIYGEAAARDRDHEIQRRA